jgi:hypothetical protein
MEILDVVVCNLDRMWEKTNDHLEKFFTKGNLRKKCLCPVDMKPYKNIKGATAYLGDNRKRKRHCEIDPDVIILFQLVVLLRVIFEILYTFNKINLKIILKFELMISNQHFPIAFIPRI